MPRPTTRGLEYTFLDKNFFFDRKVKRLKRKCGDDSPLAFIALLCLITPEGYYIKYDNDIIYDIADMTGFDEEKVADIIDTCGEVGLLDEELMERELILTSHGIQKYYAATCAQLKRKSGVEEFSLLNDKICEVSSEETGIYSEKTEFLPKKSEVIPTKEKNSKEEYSIEENTSSSLSSPSVEEEQQQEVVSETETDGSAVNERWRLRIQLEFLHRNYPNPDEEYDRFIAYNNVGGRRWDKMGDKEREAALALWSARDSRPRFQSAIHDMLYTVAFNLYTRSNGSDIPALLELVSSQVDVQVDNDFLVIFCSRELSDYLERHLDLYSYAYTKAIKKLHVKNIRYATPNKLNSEPAERAAQG